MPRGVVDTRSVEPLESAKAFELWYAMGIDRSAAKVARKLNYSDQRVVNWRKRYFWEERALARDYQQSKVIRIRANKDITETKMLFGTAIRNSILSLFRTDEETGILSFKVIPKTIHELETAVKLWLLLVGESTDIHTVKVEVIETVINQIIQVVQLHVKDPKIIGDIAMDLKQSRELISIAT